MTSPVVSVVTPFFNTAEYLAECIESVLGQTFGDFEYVLVNNCSTDGSDAVARRYAALDGRIRLINNTAFLSQVDNYNHALRQIGPHSRYCKIVQADDWIYPSCLEEMIRAAESSPNVALVGSYSLYEPLPVYSRRPYVGNTGLPYSLRLLPGREAMRRYLAEALNVFGSPTCVMFRSSDVRATNRFFRTDSPVEDIEACFDVLKRGDFAFVHQVLTFNRRDPSSYMWRLSTWNADAVNKLILLRRHGRDIFSPEEYRDLFAQLRHAYYACLADAVLEGRGAAFWRFHRDCLAAAGLTLDLPALTLHVMRALLMLLACPRALIGNVTRRLAKKRR